MIPIRKTTVWFICFMLGLSLIVSSFGGVLCFSDRGPVTIELAHLQLCCDSDPTLPTADLDQDSRHSHDCAGCSDIPLETQQWWQRTQSTLRPDGGLTTGFQVASSNNRITLTEAGSRNVMSLLAGELLVLPAAASPTVLRC
jgi:hypothetical protein